MRWLKVGIRIILLILTIYLPIRVVREVGSEYLEVKRTSNLRKEENLSEFKGEFLLRSEGFYEDKTYERRYKKLKKTLAKD